MQHTVVATGVLTWKFTIDTDMSGYKKNLATNYVFGGGRIKGFVQGQQITIVVPNKILVPLGTKSQFMSVVQWVYWPGIMNDLDKANSSFSVPPTYL